MEHLAGFYNLIYRPELRPTIYDRKVQEQLVLGCRVRQMHRKNAGGAKFDGEKWTFWKHMPAPLDKSASPVVEQLVWLSSILWSMDFGFSLYFSLPSISRIEYLYTNSLVYATFGSGKKSWSFKDPETAGCVTYLKLQYCGLVDLVDLVDAGGRWKTSESHEPRRPRGPSGP